jgi:hypothetical protein
MAVSRSVVLLSLLLLPVANLLAAPDPDIFDGRVVPPRPTESAPAVSNQTAGQDAGESDGVGAPEESASTAGDTVAMVGDDQQPAAENNGVPESAADSVASRSFEGIDQIGGQPVDHPAAPELPEPSRETASAGGPGSAEARGTAGTDATEGGASTEVRSFDGLDVGGSASREQQIEVRRSIELRPIPQTGQRPPPPTSTPERGSASSAQRERAPAEEGADIPSGL